MIFSQNTLLPEISQRIIILNMKVMLTDVIGQDFGPDMTIKMMTHVFSCNQTGKSNQAVIF
jgi:hypothetical protein